MKTLNLALWGSGFIATHYLAHLHDQRRFDKVKIVYGRTESKLKTLAEKYGIEKYTAKSKKWEPVKLEVWRGKTNVTPVKSLREYDEYHYFIKQEQLMDGTTKLILKNKTTNHIIEKVI
ncbi:MAG: hypothetical protein ACOCXH_01270 [Cyclobacteriaceae bacterium]